VKPPPKFPEPNPNDAPLVAYALRNAAALWAAGRHKDSLSLLVQAADDAQGDSPTSRMRALEIVRGIGLLSAHLDRGEDPKSIPISLEFDIESIDVQSIHVASKDVEVIETDANKPPVAAPAAKPLQLDHTLASGQKLEGAPKDWPYAKKPAPPAPRIEEKQAPAEPAPEEFEDNPHGAPTRRMDDIVTLRDPNPKKH
jgi:hypothetical protein